MKNQYQAIPTDLLEEVISFLLKSENQIVPLNGMPSALHFVRHKVIPSGQ
jgi:hypothetical protein